MGKYIYKNPPIPAFILNPPISQVSPLRVERHMKTNASEESRVVDDRQGSGYYSGKYPSVVQIA